jgi:uncharacterized metal-binding protein
MFADLFPTITVDGCEKRCAALGTANLSGKPARTLIVTELLKKRGLPPTTKLRNLGDEDKAAAQEVAAAIDEVLSAK